MVITNFGVGPWQAVAAIPAKRDYPAMFLSGYVDAAIEKDCMLKQIPWFPAPIKADELQRELRIALDEVEL